MITEGWDMVGWREEECHVDMDRGRAQGSGCEGDFGLSLCGVYSV